MLRNHSRDQDSWRFAGICDSPCELNFPKAQSVKKLRNEENEGGATGNKRVFAWHGGLNKAFLWLCFDKIASW